MGVTYSVPEMKVKLQSTQYRCDRQINKRTNQLKVQRRTVAKFLEEGRDETARINVESILREEKIILALERIKVMCMLVLNRVHTIGVKEMQTEDVLESLAGLVYSQPRIPELRELDEICAMLGARLGDKFIQAHKFNREYKVPAALVALLEFKIPTLDVVFNTLKDIANEYSVDWTPKIASPGNFYDPNAMGSVVSLDPIPPPGSSNHGPAPNGGAIAPSKSLPPAYNDQVLPPPDYNPNYDNGSSPTGGRGPQNGGDAYYSAPPNNNSYGNGAGNGNQDGYTPYDNNNGYPSNNGYQPDQHQGGM